MIMRRRRRKRRMRRRKRWMRRWIRGRGVERGGRGGVGRGG